MDEALQLRAQGMSHARTMRIPPEALEWLFTLAVVAFLVWQSAAFREPEFLRAASERYREAAELRAPMLPQAAGTNRVATLCGRYGGWLPQAERQTSAERVGLCHSDARHGAVPWREPADCRWALADAARDRGGTSRSAEARLCRHAT